MDDKQSLVYNMGKQSARINIKKNIMCLENQRGKRSSLTEQNPKAYEVILSSVWSNIKLLCTVLSCNINGMAAIVPHKEFNTI